MAAQRNEAKHDLDHLRTLQLNFTAALGQVNGDITALRRDQMWSTTDPAGWAAKVASLEASHAVLRGALSEIAVRLAEVEAEASA